MANKSVRIADFRDRITLLEIQWEIDSEMNRKEILVPKKTVWASITAKSSSFDNTQAGTRPEIIYDVVLRKINMDFGYVQYKGKICSLKAPKYDVDNKYTVFQMVEIDGNEHIIR